MKKISYFFLIFIVFQSCHSYQKDILTETIHSPQTIKNFKIDSLSIPIDSISTNHYSGISFLYEAKDDIFFVTYNKITHSIDWLSLLNEQNSFHTILDPQGPNGIFPAVEGLYIQNFDSLFINDGFNLFIINSKGVIKKKIKNLFDQDSKNSFRLYNYDTSNLYYNKERKSIISHVFFIQNSITSSTPTMAEVFIESGDFRFLNSHYPGYYIDQYKYLNSDICFNSSFYQDLIIYNFSCGSDIYTYNVDTDEVNVFGGKSKLSKNRIEKIRSNNRERLWIYYIENPRFFKVSFDPFNNLYIRLHWKEINYYKSQNRYNTPYEKEIIMSVYSKNFELLKEFILKPDTYLINTEAVTSKGLIINSNHPNNKTYDPEKYKVHTYHFEI